MLLREEVRATSGATFGPSGARALPLAAGRNKGIIPLVVGVVTTTIQNHRRGCRSFAWAPTNKNKNSGKTS